MAQTEANAFFLEESIRTLVETQVLAGEPGAYRVAKELSTMQVPATVQAVLAARIDRLPPKGKDLLQTAAVIGKDLPFPSSKPSLLYPKRRCGVASSICRAPSSSTRRTFSPTSNIPSSTPSPMMWPTAAFFRSDGAPSTTGSWRR
jgi:hypothetical protein